MATRKRTKQVVEKPKKRPKIGKTTLGSALIAGLKAQSGRKDIEFEEVAEVAKETMDSIRLEERAGYPLKFPKGAVDPKEWMTKGGKKIIVDFKRHYWLPDDWGQGVKTTNPTAHSRGTSGGTYTVIVSPDGEVFYHRGPAEEYAGYKFGREVGFNGQLRCAELQAKQAVQLARASIKDVSGHDQPKYIGVDSDESFFKLLSKEERMCLPSVDDLHFGVISARRAANIAGIADIFMVQSQCLDAGITPTWYVDESSLKDYRKLGLKSVVGGKLTPARNKALCDARRMGKACVQLSDDISAWEYRHGQMAESRDDDELNAAWKAAKRFILSPVTAARFMLAKMRAAPGDQKPQLGGVYMLGSCARSFASDEISRKHFCLGDFFVVDNSTVKFDDTMTLKEDYDFTCAHIRKHGSVMRFNRMTLNVKHYANLGGACTNRDSKGQEERKNIEILNRKWPGCFMPNPRRKNEVILRWKGCTEDHYQTAAGKAKTRVSNVRSATLKKDGAKKPLLKRVHAFVKASAKRLAKRRTSNAQAAALTKAGVKKPFLKPVVKPKASTMKDSKKLKDQQGEIEAKIRLLPKAAPDEKTEESFSLLMDGFRKYLLGRGLKETSTRSYLTCFSLLFMRDFRSYEASAGEKYMALIKQSPQNKKCHQQFHAALSHFRSFYQAKVNRRRMFGAG